MFHRKNGRRLALVVGVTTVLVATLNPPVVFADTGAPSLISVRNSSDPHVEGCSTFVGGVQHDYLCMYTSSDMNIVDPNNPPNYYPMNRTYVYTFDLSSGKNPGDPANWVDVSNNGTQPAFAENWLPYFNPNGDPNHLWAPTAHYGTKTNETLLYVPDVYTSLTIPTVSQDGRISYIAVGSSYDNASQTGGVPWGPFRYKKDITYRGGPVPNSVCADLKTCTTYMSDPAVATIGGTHPITDDHPFQDAATWLLWANGDNNGGGSMCGGISIGMLNDDDPTDLVDDPTRSVSEITVNGIGDALGTCTGLNHPYMEGPELYDLTQVNLPLPTNPSTGASEPFMLFFAAKPSGGTHGDGNQVLAWATASNVRGPYTYRGIIMDSSTTSWTNHGSITASTGTQTINGIPQAKFVLWFHDDVAANDRPHHRQVRAACLTYDRTAKSFVTVPRPSSIPDLNACVGVVN